MRIETKCLHEGYEPENGEARQLPIYQSTTWKYASSDAMGRLFDLEDSGYFYTRLQNPTNDMTAAKIAALEIRNLRRNLQSSRRNNEEDGNQRNFYRSGYARGGA